MIMTFQSEWNIPDPIWRWILLAIVPTILAAGAIEKLTSDQVLPDKQSYRTPLSDALFESSKWRTPEQPESDWRRPRSPSVGWRTESPPPIQSSRSKRTINLFPRYQPGNPNDFDHINREEKPQIKVFEFGR